MWMGLRQQGGGRGRKTTPKKRQKKHPRSCPCHLGLPHPKTPTTQLPLKKPIQRTRVVRGWVVRGGGERAAGRSTHHENPQRASGCSNRWPTIPLIPGIPAVLPLPTAKRGALEGAPCSPILLLLYFDSVLRAADRVTHPGAGVPVTTYGDDGATTLVSVRCHSLGFGVVFVSCVCPCCTRARTPPAVGCSGGGTVV